MQIAKTVVENANGIEPVMEIYGHQIMACAQRHLGNFPAAESHLLEAIKLGESTWGRSSIKLVDLLWDLEQAGIKSGNYELAEQARQRRIGMVEQINGGEVVVDEAFAPLSV